MHLEVVSKTKKPSSQMKGSEEPGKIIQGSSSIICLYQTKIAGQFQNLTVTWSKNQTYQSLCIAVENPSNDKDPYTCKIDIKPSQFWGRKGLKPLELDGYRVDIFWDFREVKFFNIPQPSSDYYVVVVYKEEIVLLLGDLKTDAYKRTKARPSQNGATLMCKKENVYGKKVFCTTVTFNEEKMEHEIVIESSLSSPEDPEMWINIDGLSMIRVMNLNWRFRGNETVLVKNKPIEIFWDVHDWLFEKTGTKRGLFIFKAKMHESDDVKEDDDEEKMNEFCHYLYAWKVEN